MTGGFLWAVVVSTAASAIVYAAICGALIQLRRRSPQADALRVPLGRAIAIVGILVSLALLTQLDRKGTIIMCATFVVAGANWWITRQPKPPQLIP